ncbi:MAG: glycosyltransferase family 39 protein [Chloroflexota bacterium]
MLLPGGVAVLNLWLSFRRPQHQPQAQGWLFWTIVIAIAAGTIFATSGLTLPIAGVMLGLAGALMIYTRFESASIQSWRRVIIIGSLAVAAMFFVRSSALASYPLFELSDEPWELARIHHGIERGAIGDFIMLALTPELEATTPKYFWIMIWWAQLTSESIWHLRLLHLFQGILTIIFTILAAKNLYSPRTAYFTAFFLIGSALFLRLMQIRNDAPVALVIAVTLWLYSIALQRQSLWLHLLAGAVMGAGGFAHLNIVVFGPALAIGLYGPLIWQARSSESIRFAAAFVFGGAALGSILLLFVILPGWETLSFYAGTRQSEDFAAYIMAFQRHITNLLSHSIVCK